MVVEIPGAVSPDDASPEAARNGRRSATGRTIALIAALGSAIPLLGLSACGGSGGGYAVPVPSMANSPGAQTAFRHVESRFTDLTPEGQPSLENELRDFLAKYATDGRAPLVRLYLAWVELERRRPAEARALTASVRRGPPGAVHDFADVVDAAALRREGQGRAALLLLEPLRGKIADPLERSIYSEELVHALLDQRRFPDSVRAMLDWAEQAQSNDRESVVAAIEALIREMPAASLEAGLRTLSEEAELDPSSKNATRAEARQWLSAAARARLVRAALTERDPELAKRLVESSSSRADGDGSEDALEALAATSAVAPRVTGRAMGVVLDVMDDVSRSRSADLVAGVTRALGLPATAAREDGVRLFTREASEAGDVQRALASLAGDGASILVAGVTDDAAIAASLFAERARIPVVVVRHPPALGEGTRFTFVLGSDVAAEEAAVAEALTVAVTRNPVRVGVGGTPCESAPAAAGQTRFPVKDWAREKVDALVLLGDATCTRDAVAESTFGGFAPLLVIGLESASSDVPGRKFVVTAGRFPFGTRPLAPDEQAWTARWGDAPSWYETLGHDAATLAGSALSTFPLARVDDASAVTALHARARDALSHAEGKLWSTAASGFGSQNVIQRELRAVKPAVAPVVP